MGDLRMMHKCKNCMLDAEPGRALCVFCKDNQKVEIIALVLFGIVLLALLALIR